jgi:protein-disulfide isomerase
MDNEKGEKKEEVSQETSDEESREEPKQKETLGDKVGITGKMRENPWMLATLVLGLLALTLFIGNFTGNSTGNVISESEAGQRLLDYYASNGAEGLSLDSVDEVSGLYKVNFEYQGSIVPIYVTKDGRYAGSLNALTAGGSGSDSVPSGSANVNRVDVSVDDDAVKGDANAPVTIIEFSDYECPFCGRHFRDTLPSIISNYVDTGKVKIVFRDFPLGFHSFAQKAGEAAECAGEQDKYWEMHDKLFENQNALSVSALKKYASEIGLNIGDFNTCLDSGEFEDEIEEDMKDGQDVGVSGTPANFVNGIMISGACPFSTFEDAIEAELAGQDWVVNSCKFSLI